MLRQPGNGLLTIGLSVSSQRVRSVFAICLLAAGCGLFRPAHRYRVTIDLGPSIRALGSEDLFESGPAEDRIVAIGPAALPALDAALDDESPAVRVGVVEVLSYLAVPERVPLLMKAVTDPDEAVRAQALEVLGGLTGDPRARPLVEAALEDPSPTIRVAAARTCARLCTSPPAVARLVDIAIRDEPFSNALWARASLAAMMKRPDTSSEARAAIERVAIPRLQDGGSLEERARAALLVADIGSPAGSEVLAAAARESTSTQVRLHALYALGTVGDARAVPTLAEILRGPQSELVPYAYDALTRMAARGVAEAKPILRAYRGPRPSNPLLPPP